MNARALEAFLARLYADAGFLEKFLDSPRTVARDAGLDEAAAAALMAMNRDDLRLAADSYARKRQRRS